MNEIIKALLHFSWIVYNLISTLFYAETHSLANFKLQLFMKKFCSSINPVIFVFPTRIKRLNEMHVLLKIMFWIGFAYQKVTFVVVILETLEFILLKDKTKNGSTIYVTEKAKYIINLVIVDKNNTPSFMLKDNY